MLMNLRKISRASVNLSRFGSASNDANWELLLPRSLLGAVGRSVVAAPITGANAVSVRCILGSTSAGATRALGAVGVAGIIGIIGTIGTLSSRGGCIYT